MSTQNYFQTSLDSDGILSLEFKRTDKEQNILSSAVLLELDQILKKQSDNPQVKGLVFKSGRKDHFIFGADISEIETLDTADLAAKGAATMQGVLSRFADFPAKTAALIHGPCLGGGLELALACHYRIVSDDEKTSLGLPEIQLGLIPGAGGTQRLPRLIGIQKSLDLILTGKRVDAKKAVSLGLADLMAPKGFMYDQAKRLILNGKQVKKKRKSLLEIFLEDNFFGRTLLKKIAGKKVRATTKGKYPAPIRALDAVFSGYAKPLTLGLAGEAQIFGELSQTDVSKSLIHLFHATTKLKKNPFKGELQKVAKTEVSQTPVGVIGAGFMGAGIATVCVDKGMRVFLSDPNSASISKAIQQVGSFFRKKLKRKKLKPHQFQQRMSHLSPGQSPEGFRLCEVTIEAVFEDLKLKQKILKNIEEQGHPDAIFATNTSAIPVKKIAEGCAHPERVIGMHFFSPVEKMPLLEIVVTKETAGWVKERVFDLGLRMGKQLIVVNDGPGFYTTRALAFFLNEAAILLSEGYEISFIDSALTKLGFPVGPITLIDEVGIDVGAHVLETIGSAFPGRIQVPQGMGAVLKSGRLGRKNGKGFYSYQDGKKGDPDQTAAALLKTEVKNNAASKDEIAERCLLLFVNESVRCLEEGVLESPEDGDVGAIFGLGFPPFFGGPFHYVDLKGAVEVCAKLEKLRAQFGARFEPSQKLSQMASTGARFYTKSTTALRQILGGSN